jgi:hypothetical protein
MPRPSAAASRAGVQMQGFHPTVCGLPSAREWPKGHRSGLYLNNEAGTSSSCPAWRTSAHRPVLDPADTVTRRLPVVAACWFISMRSTRRTVRIRPARLEPKHGGGPHTRRRAQAVPG